MKDITLKNEIESKLEALWASKTSYFSDDKYGFEECASDILKIFKEFIDERIEYAELDTFSSIKKSTLKELKKGC